MYFLACLAKEKFNLNNQVIQLYNYIHNVSPCVSNELLATSIETSDLLLPKYNTNLLLLNIE